MTKPLKKKPGRPKISKDDHRPKKKRTRKITEEQREALRQRMVCLLYTSPSPRDVEESRMPSSA